MHMRSVARNERATPPEICWRIDETCDSVQAKVGRQGRTASLITYGNDGRFLLTLVRHLSLQRRRTELSLLPRRRRLSPGAK